jgi:predicted O-methyltransferase YrrM
LEQIQENLKMMLPEIISSAIDDYIPKMDGWTTTERCCEIARVILESKAQVCVDIGVFAGRSTISMGFAVRQQGFGHVYGIDPWRIAYAIEGDDNEENAKWWVEKADLEKMHQETMAAIWAHNLDPWVTIIRNASQFVAQLFPSIDVLNIDGAHSELASCRDVELYLPRVVHGGYAFADDSDWPTTQKAMEMLGESCELITNTGKAKTFFKK